MIRSRMFAFAAGAVASLAATLAVPGMFAEPQTVPHKPAPAHREVVAEKEVAGNLAYLQLQIDSQDKITLLSSDVTQGEWHDRVLGGTGARIYYEVLDAEGTVLARGVRQDPRDEIRSNQRTPVNFILALPRTDNAEQIVIYSMGYEIGGLQDYQRSLRPLATLSVR